jgi:hypothetical protein
MHRHIAAVEAFGVSKKLKSNPAKIQDAYFKNSIGQKNVENFTPEGLHQKYEQLGAEAFVEFIKSTAENPLFCNRISVIDKHHSADHPARGVDGNKLLTQYVDNGKASTLGEEMQRYQRVQLITSMKTISRSANFFGEHFHEAASTLTLNDVAHPCSWDYNDGSTSQAVDDEHRRAHSVFQGGKQPTIVGSIVRQLGSSDEYVQVVHHVIIVQLETLLLQQSSHIRGNLYGWS